MGQAEQHVDEVADEQIADRAVRDRDQRVKDHPPRAGEDVAEGPADGVEAVGAFNGNRRIHQVESAERAKGDQRHDEAGHQGKDEKQTPDDRSDPGDVENHPADADGGSRHQDDEHGDDGREDEAEDLAEGEGQRLADRDFFIARDVHGGDARDGSAEDRPDDQEPDGVQGEDRKGCAGAASLGRR